MHQAAVGVAHCSCSRVISRLSNGAVLSRPLTNSPDACILASYVQSPVAHAGAGSADTHRRRDAVITDPAGAGMPGAAQAMQGRGGLASRGVGTQIAAAAAAVGAARADRTGASRFWGPASDSHESSDSGSPAPGLAPESDADDAGAGAAPAAAGDQGPNDANAGWAANIAQNNAPAAAPAEFDPELGDQEVDDDGLEHDDAAEAAQAEHVAGLGMGAAVTQLMEITSVPEDYARALLLAHEGDLAAAVATVMDQ